MVTMQKRSVGRRNAISFIFPRPFVGQPNGRQKRITSSLTPEWELGFSSVKKSSRSLLCHGDEVSRFWTGFVVCSQLLARRLRRLQWPSDVQTNDFKLPSNINRTSWKYVSLYHNNKFSFVWVVSHTSSADWQQVLKFSKSCMQHVPNKPCVFCGRKSPRLLTIRRA